ncbi:hypothetical protein BRARA_D01298 [Brassica rapa]|uniref:Uncharacterized protein n=1 Tax=Brassica campestris TaxID=3711 RepID=A0A397ZT57_BRACM|nr:hypothetical protein BRARA_D01298 [Brassica rapa]RID66137.1 hypothetical protein BRARA_D01298 [Brassica rapa]
MSFVASFFSAIYVTQWKELKDAPFSSKAVICASAKVLQMYLACVNQDCKTFYLR